MPSVGDYELERQIGAGASGTVWKAHRSGPVSRAVALKRLRAGSGSVDEARIRREATVLTELDHPHIVRVFEVVHDGDGVARWPCSSRPVDRSATCWPSGAGSAPGRWWRWRRRWPMRWPPPIAAACSTAT